MIGIIGGGITGLTIGHLLSEEGIEHTVFEASHQVGGAIQTNTDKGYILEKGPNTLFVDEDFLDFLASVNLANDIIHPSENSGKRFVLKKGAYRELPSHPIKLITSNFFSLKTRWKIFRELKYKKPANLPENESIASFFKRHFNLEVVDYAVSPFVGGIYAGDPAKLLVELTFPQLVSYENDYGSLLKAFKANSQQKRKQSISLKRGLQSLPDALAKSAQVLLNTSVTKITATEKGYLLTDNTNKQHHVTHLIHTADAQVTSTLIKDISPALALDFDKINYAPLSVVHTCYNKADVGNLPEGFGALHPPKENAFASGNIFSSQVFPGSCPKDEVLITTFVGGILNKENALRPEDEISDGVQKELAEFLKVNGSPVFQKVTHYPMALPQYDIAAKQLKTALEDHLLPRMHFAGNWINGVSVPDCIKKAKSVVEKILNN